MSKTPIKVYFNPVAKQLLDEVGQVIRNDSQTPRTRLTEKGIINIQLVTAYDEDTAAFTKFSELVSGTTARALVDNDYSNPEIVRTLVTGSGYWTLSGSGTNEYYYATSVDSEPTNVYENAVAMASGTVGALTAGQWDYADNDAIGENRIYVRLSDNTDPDTKTLGYMTYLLASGTYTPLFLDSQEFNNANTWYDEDTDTWRNPVITDGEISFEYNANTDDYYDRINADATAASKGYATTTMQMPLYDSATGEHFDTYEFNFYSYNRYLPDDQIKLDIATLNVYTKAEVDALVGGKMDKISPAATPGNVAVFKADGVNVEDGGALPAGGGDVNGPASSTDNALPRFNGTGGKTIQAGQTIEDDTGNVTVNGNLVADDMSADSLAVVDDPYAAGWNGDLEVPTKNAVYDEMELKAPKDLSAETVKSTLDGSEDVAIDDGGTFKATSMQTIIDAAVAAFPDVNVENGIDTPASEIDDDDNGKPVTAQRTLDTAPATVVILNHMDGTAGSGTWSDDSTFAHTKVNQGDPVLSTAQEVAAGFGKCVHLDGDDGWDYPVTNFDPGTGEFAFACKGYIADADKSTHMPLVHIATGTTTAQVLYFYLEGGFLKYKIGTNTGSGEWTDSDSREVVTAGYLNADDWNSFIIQRNGNELQAGMNGYVLMRLDMTGKTLNTPNVASRIRFAYDIDAVSSPDNFFTGYMDEVVLWDGAKFLDIAVSGVTPTTYEDYTTEQYVTKVYDIGPSATGEANTNSNTGSAGVGIYKQKVGVDNELYKLLGDDGISIALDGTDKIDVKVDIASETAMTDIAQADEHLVSDGGVIKKITTGHLRDVIHNAQTGTSYSLALTDPGGLTTMNNASANTVTIPANTTTAIPVDSGMDVMQIGAGVTTIQAASGVTLNGVVAGSVAITAQFGAVSLWKEATNVWYAIGAI